MTDNGARALAKALFLYRTSSNIPLPADYWERQSKAMQTPFFVEAAAILANGAAFLPAAELDRLRRIEAAARALNSKPERAVTDARALAVLRAALQPEGSAGTRDWNQRILAEFDRLVREHGESCDCSVCLAVQSLVDVTLAAEGSARDGG